MLSELESSLDRIQEYKWTDEALKEICLIRAKGEPNPLDYKILKKEKAFYIFNDQFPKQYISDNECARFGFYFKEDLCKYYKRLMLPVRDVMGNIVAFNAYTNDEGFPKYQLSSKTIWNRDKYFYASSWDYEEGFRRGYIHYTDGSFDRLRLNSIDEPCLGGLGSAISKEQIAILSQYINIIYDPDNDAAGFRVLKELREVSKLNVCAIERMRGKDIDDYFSYDKGNEIIFKNTVQKIINSRFSLNFKI